MLSSSVCLPRQPWPLRLASSTSSTGAESAQIERMAAVTVALGDVKRNDDGTDNVTISVGKTRMGEGDRVIPAEFAGVTGAWRVLGPSVPAGQHQAGKEQAQTAKRLGVAKLSIAAFLAKAAAPLSKVALSEALALRRTVVIEAVEALLADSESGVVEVRPAGKRNGPGRPVWMRDLATSAGVDIVPRMAVL